MFDRACWNIDNVVLNELGHPWSNGKIKDVLGLSSAVFFRTLSYQETQSALPLLERLNSLAEEFASGRARNLFAAAVSGLSSKYTKGQKGDFALITKSEVQPIMAEIAALSAEDWEQNFRHRVPVQRETRSIMLTSRAPRPGEIKHGQYVTNGDYSSRFPHLMRWLEGFAKSAGMALSS